MLQPKLFLVIERSCNDLINDDAAERLVSETTEGVLQDGASAGAERTADHMSVLKHKSLRLLALTATLRDKTTNVVGKSLVMN